MVPTCVFAYPTSIVKRSVPGIIIYFSKGQAYDPYFYRSPLSNQ